MNNKTLALNMNKITHVYNQGDTEIRIFSEADFSLRLGETVALVGPSGSGKSTFLQIGGLLEKPDKGDIFISGHKSSLTSDKQTTLLRSRYLGFVYQHHHLLNEFNALENVIIPQLLLGKSKKDSTHKARFLLKRLGLGDRETHRPNKLSGGEQQRVAIARALSNDPQIILADEPTGNLDQDTADLVFDFLLETIDENGLSVVFATHNLEFAKRMNRTITITNGKIAEV
ncbi:MAG: ABC transporter [Rhodospirillaceae bacterium]|nr:ABC transporter [Rhodospirillaceae bacterium]